MKRMKDGAQERKGVGKKVAKIGFNPHFIVDTTNVQEAADNFSQDTHVLVTDTTTDCTNCALLQS